MRITAKTTIVIKDKIRSDMEKTIEIPEGYEARIEGNKVILEQNDESIRNFLYEFIKICSWSEKQFPPRERCLAYLERRKGHKPAEWSEEDEKMLRLCENRIMGTSTFVPTRAGLYDMVSWLKSLRPQPKQEWSETDKLHLNNAILVAKKEWGVNSYTARWLESLRDNYKKCNSRWKPSEEQMDAIQYVSNFDYGGHRKALESLYSDIKKL